MLKFLNFYNGLFILLFATTVFSQNIQHVTAEAFKKQILAQKKPQLVDVRTAEEFAKGAIKNAINIDVKENDFTNKINNLNKNKAVFVYCMSGRRSKVAAEKLKNAGFKKIIELNTGYVSYDNQETENTLFSLDDYQKIIASHDVVVVNFYADWCEPCVKMKPIWPQLEKNYKNVKIVRLNIDQNKKLHKSLQLEGLPNTLIYKNSQRIFNQAGLCTYEAISQKL